MSWGDQEQSVCVITNIHHNIILKSSSNTLHTAPTGTTKAPSFTVREARTFICIRATSLLSTVHAFYDSLQYAARMEGT